MKPPMVWTEEDERNFQEEKRNVISGETLRRFAIGLGLMKPTLAPKRPSTRRRRDTRWTGNYYPDRFETVGEQAHAWAQENVKNALNPAEALLAWAGLDTAR